MAVPGAGRATHLAVQAVTVLRFADDGTVLVSGGEDTLASAWLLMDLLDASAGQSATQAPQPFHSWCAKPQTRLHMHFIYVTCAACHKLATHVLLLRCLRLARIQENLLVSALGYAAVQWRSLGCAGLTTHYRSPAFTAAGA